MVKQDKTVNQADLTGGRHSRSGGSVRQPSTPTSRTGAGRLQLPPGEADLEALRSVTREWLVPRLVEKFLRMHKVELRHSRKFSNRLQPSSSGEGSLIPGSAATKEIRSQVKKKTNTKDLCRGGHE